MAQYILGTTPLYPDIDLQSQTLSGTPTTSGMGDLPLQVERVLRTAEYVVDEEKGKAISKGWWVQVQLLGQRYFAEADRLLSVCEVMAMADE
jgi:hypothetical protein